MARFDNIQITDEQLTIHQRVDQDYVKKWCFTTDKQLFGLQGPRGSGKTLMGGEGLFGYSYFEPDMGGLRGTLLAINHDQIDSFKEEVVIPLYERMGLADHCNFGKLNWTTPNISGKDVRWSMIPFGEEGAMRRAERLRGANLGLVYADEMNNGNIKILDMIIQCFARGRGMTVETKKKCRGVFTGNPRGDNHPYQTDFLQSEDYDFMLDYKVLPFWANPTNTDFDKKKLLATFSSESDYLRYYEGIPADDDNVVYPNLRSYVCETEEVPDKFDDYYVGFDFGSTRVTAVVLIGRVGHKFWVIDEWYHNGEVDGVLEAKEQVSRAYKFVMNLTGGVEPRLWAVDPNAGRISERLESTVSGEVVEGHMERRARAENVGKLMQRGELLISRKCVNTIREMSNYEYEKVTSRNGKEKITTKKVDDHTVDAVCFPFEYYNLFMYEATTAISYVGD